LKKLLIIFRGWSSTKTLYKEVEKVYEGYRIIHSEDMDSVDIKDFGEVALLAWSMGTLDAIEYSRENTVKSMVLISPTLNFTKTVRPVIVKKMIKRLITDKEGCLMDFTRLCFIDDGTAERYWNEYKDEILEIDSEKLREGLEKLLNKKIDIFSGMGNPLVITASDDMVISRENSMDVLEVYKGAVHKEIAGGHNLFFEGAKEINKLIKDYTA